MKLPDGIFVLPSFLSSAECEHFISLSEEGGYEAATLSTTEGAVLQPDIRNNSRLIWDDFDLANQLWLRARPHIPLMLKGRQAVGFNERFRFYRYDVGQQFVGHVDAPFRRETGEASQLTFLMYLNDDFEGGETTFDEVSIKPQRGAALVFLHELFHEGTTLVRGRKYVLRTDVMYNPAGRFSAG